MKEIYSLLMNNRIEKQTIEHNITKKQNEPNGLVNKLWDWGIELRDGLITEQELDRRIDEYRNKKSY